VFVGGGVLAGIFVLSDGVIAADSTASAVHEIAPSVHQAGEVAEKFHSLGFIDVGHGLFSSVAGRVKPRPMVDGARIK